MSDVNLNKNLKDRLIVNLVSIFIGVTIGLGANIIWLMARGFFLGWSDSAPNWYFNIQSYVHYGMIIIPVLLCVIFANRFYFQKEPRK